MGEGISNSIITKCIIEKVKNVKIRVYRYLASREYGESKNSHYITRNILGAENYLLKQN